MQNDKPSLIQTFYEHSNKSTKQKQDNDSIDHMIRLIMCSGAKIPEEFYDEIIKKKKKTYIESQIVDLYESLEMKKTPLKEKLAETMNCLMENNNFKKKLIKEMEHIMRCVPSVCICIIYEYQEFKSKARYIDWLGTYQEHTICSITDN